MGIRRSFLGVVYGRGGGGGGGGGGMDGTAAKHVRGSMSAHALGQKAKGGRLVEDS